MSRVRGPGRPAMLSIKALLLLAVFFGAGTTFPSLDALLYHTRGPDLEGSRIHLEPAGPCPAHAAHCTLGRAAPGSGSLSANSTVIRIAIDSSATPAVTSVSPSLTFQRDNLAQPRAPPISIG